MDANFFPKYLFKKDKKERDINLVYSHVREAIEYELSHYQLIKVK